MSEELLHYIWKYRKFTNGALKTSAGQPIEIIDFGSHNKYSGPDFLNARIIINRQLWAGNVEIHRRTSDWFLHGHHEDEAYNNVILHIVWEEDRALLRENGEPVPTLELSQYVDRQLLNKYNELLLSRNKQFIPCEDQISAISFDGQNGWWEKIYRERLLDKTQRLMLVLKSFQMDWERLLFISLLRNFGQRVNANSFLTLALALDFNLVRRLAGDTYRLECLLMGLCGILEKYRGEPTAERMREEYLYLKRKYNLIEEPIEKPEFMGVRPSNFPTIRLSQFAGLYSKETAFFSKLVVLKTREEFYEFFDVQASAYWRTHYVFGKSAVENVKKLSRAFIDNILINTVLPVKYIFNREHGRDIFPELKNILRTLSKEENILVDKYRKLGFTACNAMDSQVLIQLHNDYCARKRCLDCALGTQILN